MKIAKGFLALGIGAFFSTLVCMAAGDQYTVPNVFSPGQLEDANQINQNFSALNTGLNNVQNQLNGVAGSLNPAPQITFTITSSGAADGQAITIGNDHYTMQGFALTNMVDGSTLSVVVPVPPLSSTMNANYELGTAPTGHFQNLQVLGNSTMGNYNVTLMRYINNPLFLNTGTDPASHATEGMVAAIALPNGSNFYVEISASMTPTLNASAFTSYMEQLLDNVIIGNDQPAPSATS